MSLVESNDAWLGKAPKDWQRSRIRNVAALSPGYSATAPVSDELCTVVPMESLSDDGAIDTSNQEVLADVTSGLTLFEKGDVLFAKITPCMENGKGAFVRELATRYAFGSTEFHVLRPSKKIDGNFLYYYTFNPIYRAFAAENMVGAAGQKRVSTRFVKDTRMFLPPLLEQRCIAAYLDASCAVIDAAVALKQKQVDTLEEMYRSELHAAFDHPEWKRERIKDVTTKIGSGVTPEGGAANYLDEGIPLLRSQNVHFDGLRLDDVAFISPETHADMSGSQLKPRDVLLNITGASIGRCTFVPDNFGEGNVNQHVCIMRPNHQIDHRFLAAFLSSPLGQSEVFSGFTGASRQGLGQRDLGAISVPLPLLTEQHDVMVEIEERSRKSKEIREVLGNQMAALAAYRKSLIHECVTGQRRITEKDLNRITAHA